MEKVSTRSVRRELRDKRDSGEKLFIVLSDPEKPLEPRKVLLFEESGADVLLVGGSLNVMPYDIDEYVAKLREAGVQIPIVLFPGGLNNIARSADAILFMVLMNSLDPYWLMEAQVTAAPLIKRLQLEAIPTGYVIVGYGGAAGHVGRALPVAEETPYIVGAYAAAAELFGFDVLYLEAGSGSPRPVPSEAVAAARKGGEKLLLIVGGGIREPDQARDLLAAGADGVVVGTIAEKDTRKALDILQAVKHR